MFEVSSSVHRRDLDVEEYLTHVFTQMNRGTASPAERLPDVWKQCHLDAVRTYSVATRRTEPKSRQHAPRLAEYGQQAQVKNSRRGDARFARADAPAGSRSDQPCRCCTLTVKRQTNSWQKFSNYTSYETYGWQGIRTRDGN